MDEQHRQRLATLLGLGALLCMSAVSYLNVPMIYSIQRDGAGVIDSAVLSSSILGTLIGLAVRRTASAAAVGFVLGLSLAMLSCSMGPYPIRE